MSSHIRSMSCTLFRVTVAMTLCGGRGDIPASTIIPDLLAAHGLTGCDTVATYFGIGKAAALRVLTSGVHALTYVGDTSHILSEVTAQATPFILACYGQTKCTSLTAERGTPENVGKQSGLECDWCTKPGFSASNK